MKHIPIRLGPLALLLTVISICMTTLGILAFTTARADYSLAEKYADTVRERYELEREGQLFLREAEEWLAAGGSLSSLEGAVEDETGVVRRNIERGSFSLKVGIIPDGESGFRVVEWRIQKEWEPEESIGGLWTGE